MRKKKELKVIDGKKQEFAYTTLDSVWGDTGMTKYGTMDVEEYKTQLAEMTKADLQAHAAKHGIIPIGDRERLIKKLVSEFCGYVATFRQPVYNPPQVVPSKEVLKILAEGR